MWQQVTEETIVAVATPPGFGGVGIVRVSGPKTTRIAETILKTKELKHSQAFHASFWTEKEEIIDKGIAIYFKAPNSFTGEDVLELHAHGSPVVLDLLLQAACSFGARPAQPGEFSKRAFLSGKIDLLQAESIASLIHAQTEQAAKAALKSLQGGFSKQVNKLSDFLFDLRMRLEAAINFPEDVSLQESQKIIDNVFASKELAAQIIKTAKQSVLLNKGIKLVLLGEPNVGKSSLLNFLSQRDVAIVTAVAGTTRDVITSTINIDGLLIEVADTAGIRAPQDIVEAIGIDKALAAAAQADLVILMLDLTAVGFKPDQVMSWVEKTIENSQMKEILFSKKTLIVVNKIDLRENAEKAFVEQENVVFVSITKELGIDNLKQKIKKMAGFFEEEPLFSARKRHVLALETAFVYLEKGCLLLDQKHYELDLLAEELKLAQQCLLELTGKGSGEALLDKIFSEFCIGK